MELIVIIGLVAVVYSAVETWRDFKPAVNECLKVLRPIILNFRFSIKAKLHKTNYVFYPYCNGMGSDWSGTRRLALASSRRNIRY